MFAVKERALLVSGGNGRLASELRAQSARYGCTAVCLSAEHMDVTDKLSIDRAIVEYQPDVFIHCAAVLDNCRTESALEINIIGTVNVVVACIRHGVKLVYISTDYVYPADKLEHTEDDPLLPSTSYAWTKLGGECAVRTYSNSLIIRGALCPRPYPHRRAYSDVQKNMIYQDKAAAYILQLLDEKGILNVGEATLDSLLEFARRTRCDVESAISPPEYAPKYSYLSINKLTRALSKGQDPDAAV